MVDEVLHSALEQAVVSEIDNTVADEHTLHVEFLVSWGVGVQVVVIDPHGQVWDVLACVGLAGNPEGIFTILGIVSEEELEGLEVIVGGVEVVVLVGGVGVGRVADTTGRLQK